MCNLCQPIALSLTDLQEIHGEGCPANWKEGAETIKLDPKGKLEWFEKNLANGTSDSKANGKRGAPVEDVEMNGHVNGTGASKKIKA